MAEALTAKKYADMPVFPRAKLLGTYQRKPVENPWHEVIVSLTGGNLKWNNAAGVIWGLEIIGTELWWAAASQYGAQKAFVEIDENENVTAIRINGERYVRTGTPPAAP